MGLIFSHKLFSPLHHWREVSKLKCEKPDAFCEEVSTLARAKSFLGLTSCYVNFCEVLCARARVCSPWLLSTYFLPQSKVPTGRLTGISEWVSPWTVVYPHVGSCNKTQTVQGVTTGSLWPVWMHVLKLWDWSHIFGSFWHRCVGGTQRLLRPPTNR